MHIGAYDDEPKTEALMHEYMESQGYALDITKAGCITKSISTTQERFLPKS